MMNFQRQGNPGEHQEISRDAEEIRGLTNQSGKGEGREGTNAGKEDQGNPRILRILARPKRSSIRGHAAAKRGRGEEGRGFCHDHLKFQFAILK